MSDFFHALCRKRRWWPKMLKSVVKHNNNIPSVVREIFLLFDLVFRFSFLVLCDKIDRTEWGDSVVTHETRIREVPPSNLRVDQPLWGFFMVSLSHQGKCWVGFSLPQSTWLVIIKFIFFLSSSCYLSSSNVGVTPLGVTTQIPVDQRSTDFGL